VVGSFLIDGVNKLAAAWRGRAAGSPRRLLIVGVVNVVLSLVLTTRWPVSGQAVVLIVVGLRMLTAGWSILLSRDDDPVPLPDAPLAGRHPDRRLGLPAHQEFGKLQASLNAEDEGRRRIDAAWSWTFVVVFF